VAAPPAAKPVIAEPVVDVAPASAEVAVEPAATPVELQPIIESNIETPTPQVVAVPDILPVAATLKTKGDTIMTDVLETAKTYAEEAKTRIQGAMTEMGEKAKVAMEKSSKAFEEMGELTKGNLEAVVESSKIAAKGVESISQGAADFGRKSFEKTTATMKSFASVKTPAEFFQLQSELMSSMMDSFASESAKSSEAMLKLVSDISQPISNRVSIVTEKVKALAA
jgi:phasin family protein